MKKRVLSLFMALALCLTLLPTAVFAETADNTVQNKQDGTNVNDSYVIDKDTEVKDEEKHDAAVEAVQALIDALPDEVTADNAEELEKQLVAIETALVALTDEQVAKLNTARYEALCASMNTLTAVQENGHSHPICGAAHKNFYSDDENDNNDHTGECPNVTWTAWNGTNDIIYTNNTAYVYLTANAEREATVEIKKDYTLYLCLNGHSITKNNNDKEDNDGVIKIYDGGTLSLCDCNGSNEGNGKITHADGKMGRGVRGGQGTSSNGIPTFNMFGGEISGNHSGSTAAGQDGGGVYMQSGNFTMYGGKITGNDIKKAQNGYGGGVYMYGGSFTMYDGEISNNKTVGTDFNNPNGGGIYALQIKSVNIQGGTISGNTAANNGGGIYISNSPLTLSSGAVITKNTVTNGDGGGVYYRSTSSSYKLTISDTAKIAENTATGNGGGIYVEQGTVNMEGGTIGENTATGDGGGVYVAAYKDRYENQVGTFNMSNGTITGNTASNGGGVYVGKYDYNNTSYFGTFNLTGGSITGNSVNGSSGSYGGGVYNNGTMTVSGNVTVSDNKSGTNGSTTDNVFLPSGKSITIGTGGLGSGASIGVSTDTIALGSYATVATLASGVTYTAGSISPDKGGEYTIKVVDSDVRLYNGLHEHPVCGKTCGHSGEGAHTDVTFKPWSNATSLPTSSGNWYLTQNVTLTSIWTPADGVVLCLNGHSITVTADKDAIHVKSGTFTLTDCDGSRGTYRFKQNSSQWVPDDSSGTITVSGGIITHASGKNGGGVEVSNSAVFTMYGGTICGNSNFNGGGVYVYSGGTFNMSGGKVAGNTTDDGGGGGGVYSFGTFDLYGGTITGNSANIGGGVYAGGDASFTMNGSAVITGNTATGSGGGVYTQVKTFKLISGTITDNAAANNGGGVFTGAGNSYMSGGTISANKAEKGGGVYVGIGSGFTLTNGTIGGSSAADANTAGFGGGVYMGDGGVFTAQGGTITGNSAGHGGGVYADSVLKLSGNVAITGNTTSSMTGCGGGVYAKTLTVSDSVKISGNTANYDGGGVFVSNGSFIMSGGSITGNTATGIINSSAGNGGGVYVGNISGTNASFTMTGGSVTGNSAANKGSGVFMFKAPMTVSGSVQIKDNWKNGTLSGGVYVKGDDGSANNLYLYDSENKEQQTVTIAPAGLNSDASICMTTQVEIPASGGSVTVATKASALTDYDKTAFISDAGYGTAYMGDKRVLFVNGTHNHPICGASCTDGTHDSVEWIGVSSVYDIKAAGHYYLTANDNALNAWQPVDGVVLCLNGHGIANTVSNRAIFNVGNGVHFTLTDCNGSNGSKYFTIDNDTGRWDYSYEGAEGAFAVGGGHIYRSRTGYGETSTDGLVTVASGGTFDMYGGTICGGVAKENNGGGVYVHNGGAFNMYGGAVTGNVAIEGSGVYVEAGSRFTVGGAAKVTGNVNDNVFLTTGAVITIDESLTNSASIGVTTETTPTKGNPVKIAADATGELNYAAIFTPDVKNAEYAVTRKDTELFLAVHTHDWQYTLSEDKATITVTCSNEDGHCPTPDGGSVTITKPSHTVYGDSKDADATTSSTLISSIQVPNIVYSKDGQPLTYAPVSAGDYTASITMGGVTASVDYTIDKATLTADDFTYAAPTDLIYDGKTRWPSITPEVDGVDDYYWSYYDESGNQVSGGLSVGTYQLHIRVTETENYQLAEDLTSSDWTFTITQREVTLTWNDFENRTYGDGKTVTATAGNLVNGDDIKVTVDNGDQQTSGTYTATATALTGDKAGNYKLPTKNLTKEYTIDLAAQKLTFARSGDQSVVYGDTLANLATNDRADQGGSTVAYTSSNTDVATVDENGTVTAKKVGTVTITAKANAVDGMYTEATASYELNVTPKPIKVMIRSTVIFYGETPTFTAVVRDGTLVGNDTIESLGLTLTSEATATSNVGSYDVTGTASNKNYNVTIEGSKQLTIQQRPVTVTVDAASRAYGEENPTFTAKWSGGQSFVNGDTIESLGLRLTSTADTTSPTGSYDVSGTASNKNYAVGIDGAGKLTVTPKAITVTVDAVSRFYGDANPTFIANVPKDALVGGDTIASLGLGLTSTATATSPVGKYDVTGDGEYNSNYTVTIDGAQKLTVNPKAITVTAENKTSRVGYDLVELTYTYEPALIGDDAFTGALTTNANKDVVGGSYTITQGTLALNGNYTITFNAGTYTVTSKLTQEDFAFAESDLTKTYGDPEFAAAATGAAEGSAVTYTSDNAAVATVDENGKVTIHAAGTAVIKATASATQDYAERVISYTLTVESKPVTADMIADIPAQNYTGSAIQPEPEIKDGDTVMVSSTDFDFSYDANTNVVDGGKVTITGKGNYTGAAFKTFTISPKSITGAVITLDRESLAYNGLEQTLNIASVTLDGWMQAITADDYAIVNGSNKATDASDSITLTIEGKGNYTGTATKTWKITKIDPVLADFDVTPDLVAALVYDGDPKTVAVTVKSGIHGMGTVTVKYNGGTEAPTNAGGYAVTIDVADGSNYNAKEIGIGTLTINKATVPTLSDICESYKYTLTGEKTVNVSGLVAGATGYTLGAAIGNAGIISAASVDTSGVVKYTLTGAGKTGDSVTLPVTIASTNYANAIVNVVITLTAREDQAALTVTGGSTVVYGQTLQLGAEGGSGTGAVTYAVTNGSGEATIDANGVLTPVKVGSVTVIATKAGDSDYNAVDSAPFTVAIMHATPTGEPKYTAITSGGKTLSDAGLTLTGSTMSPNAGTLEWVDEDGNVLLNTTVVEANKTYQWRFTPADTNYARLTGSVELYHVTYGGGGGSSAPTITVPVTGSRDTVQVSASVSNGTAEVAEIEKSELEKVGTDSDVTIDLSGLDKNVTGVTLPKDTIRSISESEADGVTIKLPNAELRVDQKTLASAAEQAKGDKVQLVVETDSKAKDTMTAAQKQALDGMKNAAALEAYFVSNGQRIRDFNGGEVELSIPYQASGAIRAWYLKEDGTREPVSARYDRENARLILRHFSHYVIEEVESGMGYAACAKDDTCPLAAYADLVPTAWYHDGVHYCIENGLMQGVSTASFLPNGSTTRAQLVTILWRLEGSPETDGTASFGDVADGAWYAKAVRWAADSGVVKGYENGNFGPDDAVTREQMVTILYRYAQYKGYDVSVGEDTNILSFNDALTVRGYAIPAMQWACGSGLVTGIEQDGGMLLAPKDTTTRVQTATLMMRFYTVCAK